MTSEKKSAKEYAIRYLVGTLGMALAAFGPAFSIKSDLGTAPYPCPPYILHLWDSSWTVGEFTALENLAFIVAQLLILRKKFKPALLMQIPAIFLFSLFIDGAIWLCSPIVATGFASRLLLCILAVFFTAAGISLEVVGKAWMLPGDQTISALTDTFGWKFSNTKIGLDIFLVAFTAIFSMIQFGHPQGPQGITVIGIGTLILMVFTGLCMKVTTPLADRILKINKTSDNG